MAGEPGQNGKGAAQAARKRERGSIAVTEMLREEILTLKLQPGSPLDELALAERFGLSRTPIREALLMLSKEAFVTFLANRTAIVTPHVMSNAHQYMDSMLLHSRAIARLAADERTDDHVSLIKACALAFEDACAGTDILKIVAADLALHRAISDASGNWFLDNFYKLSLDYGRRQNMLHYYPLFGPDERQVAIAEHQQLVAAIEARDADRAEQVAAAHLQSELLVIQRSLGPRSGAKFKIDLHWTEK